jgi:hypothetical protein
MGLHRDPASYTTNPIETQIRRLIWFHIGFLDIRTCESTGPHPQIRRDEYNTQFPLNVNDVELQQAFERGEQVLKDSKHFTDMTVSRMRFECYEMHRVMWTERPKLQRPVEKGEKKPTVTSLLSRIQAFMAAMEKKYLPMMNKSNPQHVVAMEMYNISSLRLYINVLHPFMSTFDTKMPTRLRDIMISSCIMIVEHSMNIEQQPALKRWAWYIGALHQFHVALLLLTEMSHMRASSERQVDARLDRMWHCVDYCFELPPDSSRLDKIRMVLTELSDRCGAYATIRRIRGPTNLTSPGLSSKTAEERRSSQNLRTYGSEGRDRSLSTQSSSGGYIQDTNPQVQQHYLPQQPPPQPPQQQQQQHYVRPSVPPRAPLGSMPQVDWGTFDMGTASPHPPPLPYGADPAYDFSNFVPAPSVSPNADLLNVSKAGGSSERSNSTGPYGPPAGSVGSGSDTNPLLAAMNEIDWVSTLLFLFSTSLIDIGPTRFAPLAD